MASSHTSCSKVAPFITMQSYGWHLATIGTANIASSLADYIFDRSGVGRGSRVGGTVVTYFCVVRPSEGIHIKGFAILHIHG